MNSQYGPIQESVEVLQRLFSLAPNDYRIPFQLARLHAEMGDNEQARQYGETALTLAPDNDKPEIRSFIDSLE